MRDINDVIRQKKAEQNKLQYEIDMLNSVIKMLEEEAPTETQVEAKAVAPSKWP